MVTFYVMRIEAGKMALAQVPERWRAQVSEKLKT